MVKTKMASSKRSNVPYKNGARIGAVSCELAIQIPKLLIPVCTSGQKAESTIAAITERRITTNGTKRFPLKNESASGSLRKL